MPAATIPPPAPCWCGAGGHGPEQVLGDQLRLLLLQKVAAVRDHGHGCQGQVVAQLAGDPLAEQTVAGGPEHQGRHQDPGPVAAQPDDLLVYLVI